MKVTQQAGGDSDAAAAIEYGNNCSAAKGTGYDTFDIALWDWFSYTDPDFQLSVPTRDQWCSWNDQGYDNPSYNAMYKQEGISAGAARKTLVQKMDKLHLRPVHLHVPGERGGHLREPAQAGAGTTPS